MKYSKTQLRRKENGLCIKCGNHKETPSILFCKSCNSKHKAYTKQVRQYRRTNNLCLDCGGKIDRKNKTRCSKCWLKQSKRFAEMMKLRKKKGLCRCGKKAIIKLLCEVCWFKQQARWNTGTGRNWSAIKQLLEKQDYKCVYTGKQLTPGKNASIDHIIPKCQGGNDSFDNLQWVDKQINTKMKFNMSHNEFIALIKTILRNVNQSTTNRFNP